MAGNGAEFYDLWKSFKRGDVIEALDTLLADAEVTRDDEHFSATRIQRLYRGEHVRQTVRAWRAACVVIARVHRGHTGRGRACRAAADKSAFEELAVFQYHAVHAQRAFRGYYSRRYRHDYNARKAYILSVVEKGEQLRARLQEHLRAQRDGAARAMKGDAEQEFAEVTANLHHLVSTKNIPGVYNSPYMQDNLPAALGRPIEDHLRASTKELLRSKQHAAASAARYQMSADLNGALKVPVVPTKDKRSLQASSRYDAPLEAGRMDLKLSRLAHVGQADFRAGHKQHDHPYQRGLNKGSQYFDPWKNPFLVRGIPNEGEVLQGKTRTSLGKAPPMPFYTSVGGNKSSVHANGRFDVIADSERTGGVTGRHRAMALGMVAHTGQLVDSEQDLYASPEYQSAVVEHEMALMDRRHMGSAHAALPALPFPTSATLGSSSAPGSRGGGGFHESRSAR